MAIETLEKTIVMKTVSKSIIVLIVLSLSTSAQVKNNNQGGPKSGVLVPHTVPQSNQTEPLASSQASGQNQWSSGNGFWGPNSGSYGSVTFGYGNYYSANPYPNFGYYQNGYSIKKSTKQAIRNASYIINEAIAFNTWNEIYSPLLAKAIRHYNYAQQLYWWGNFNAALNHAERARYLAWYSLQYFQNSSCNNGFGDNMYGAPNPYSDPNNPYYKKIGPDESNPGAEESGHKKQAPINESIDTGLPTTEISDQNLIKNFDKSALKNE